MMGATFNVESYARAISCNVLVQATCSPWIKLAIRENGISHSHEILFVVEAAEVTQGPVIVWSQSISILAHLGVLIVVKCLLNEHRVVAESDGHGQLVASQDIPAVAVKVTRSFPVREVGARVITGIVEVNICGISEGCEELPLAIGKSTAANFFLFNLVHFFDNLIGRPDLLRHLVLEVLELVLDPVPFISWVVCLCLLQLRLELACNLFRILFSSWDVGEGLDSLLDGPCWHGFEEGGRVGVVCHSHVLVAVTVVLIQVVNIARVCNRGARFKDLGHLSPLIGS